MPHDEIGALERRGIQVPYSLFMNIQALLQLSECMPEPYALVPQRLFSHRNQRSESATSQNVIDHRVGIVTFRRHHRDTTAREFAKYIPPIRKHFPRARRLRMVNWNHRSS